MQYRLYYYVGCHIDYTACRGFKTCTHRYVQEHGGQGGLPPKVSDFSLKFSRMINITNQNFGVPAHPPKFVPTPIQLRCFINNTKWYILLLFVLVDKNHSEHVSVFMIYNQNSDKPLQLCLYEDQKLPYNFLLWF